ncbi:methylglyoxal synthase [Chitinophagaceae bacterium MMS25-I14]
MAVRILGSKKRIALVAHDNKKEELIGWAEENREILAMHTLFATGTTGSMLEARLAVPIAKYFSGPLGGDMQIGADIANGNLDMLIFFWDPMEAQAHDPDIKALLRVAVTYNIPLACDRATADFLLTSPLIHMEYQAVLPDYSAYLKRKI